MRNQDKKIRIYKKLLTVGGILNFISVLIHIFIVVVSGNQWLEALAIQSGLMFLFLSFVGITYIIIKERPFGLLEKASVLMIGGFYVFRVIRDIPFIGTSDYSMFGAILTGFCILVAACYMVPLFILFKFNDNNYPQIG